MASLEIEHGKQEQQRSIPSAQPWLLAASAAALLVLGATLGFFIGRGRVQSVPVQSTAYPPRYGKIQEKTIWFYYDKGFDPMPSPLVELCVQTWKLHHPDWNFELVSDTNVHEYLHPRWLPDSWVSVALGANKKDAVMAAMLGVYGGIAADATIISFKSLTGWWDEMLEDGQTLRAYQYRLDEPWGGADGAAAWFLMARRDSGIFRRYMQDLSLRMGSGTSSPWEAIPGKGYLALASGTLDPILEEVDYTLPRCRDDGLPHTDGLWPIWLWPGPYGCSRPVAHMADNQALNNVKIKMLDPLNEQYGPQLGHIFDLTGQCKKAQCSGLWDEYKRRFDSGHEDFRMVKLFARGGPWTREQKLEALVLPHGTPEDAEHIISVMFKDAGLLAPEGSGAVLDGVDPEFV